MNSRPRIGSCPRFIGQLIPAGDVWERATSRFATFGDQIKGLFVAVHQSAIEVICELKRELLRPEQAPSKRRSKPRD
jgi:hypothetical protein